MASQDPQYSSVRDPTDNLQEELDEGALEVETEEKEVMEYLQTKAGELKKLVESTFRTVELSNEEWAKLDKAHKAKDLIRKQLPDLERKFNDLEKELSSSRQKRVSLAAHTNTCMRILDKESPPPITAVERALCIIRRAGIDFAMISPVIVDLLRDANLDHLRSEVETPKASADNDATNSEEVILERDEKIERLEKVLGEEKAARIAAEDSFKAIEALKNKADSDAKAKVDQVEKAAKLRIKGLGEEATKLKEAKEAVETKSANDAALATDAYKALRERFDTLITSEKKNKKTADDFRGTYDELVKKFNNLTASEAQSKKVADATAVKAMSAYHVLEKKFDILKVSAEESTRQAGLDAASARKAHDELQEKLDALKASEKESKDRAASYASEATTAAQAATAALDGLRTEFRKLKQSKEDHEKETCEVTIALTNWIDRLRDSKKYELGVANRALEDLKTQTLESERTAMAELTEVQTRLSTLQTKKDADDARSNSILATERETATAALNTANKALEDFKAQTLESERTAKAELTEVQTRLSISQTKKDADDAQAELTLRTASETDAAELKRQLDEQKAKASNNANKLKKQLTTVVEFIASSIGGVTTRDPPTPTF
ncbi:hypothetical protein WAI453_011474 [Rhynchosporium graminicola]